MTVQAMPQGGTRGHPSQSQSAGEESVLAESLDGLKVSLSLAKQPHHSHEHIAVRDARAYGKGGIYQLRRLCEAMQGLANKGQSGQGGQRATTLFQDKSSWFHAHPLGETRQIRLYR